MYRVHILYRTASEKASTKVSNYWSAIEEYAVKPDPWRLSLKQTNKQKQDSTRHNKTKNKFSKTFVDCRKSLLESIYQPTIEKKIQHFVFLKWISAQFVQSTHLIQEHQRESVHKGHKMLECHRRIRGKTGSFWGSGFTAYPSMALLRNDYWENNPEYCIFKVNLSSVCT